MTNTITPADHSSLATAVREAFETETPLYPVGGGTSLEYGLPPARPGKNLALSALNRVIDYPARDMTITVEAGITMAALAATLAAERQRLPIDAPQADRATLGGVIATNASGPLRFAHGTIRDYVIGITAVDGRGTAFKGGGRVVKNVAGYDFCKLLCGSLGTLGVIAQVTLKVKPIPEQTALLACRVASLDEAERLLAALVTSQTAPAAVELIAGPAWSDDPALEPLAGGEFGHLIVALEGTNPEVEWMQRTLAEEWKALGHSGHTVSGEQAAGLWSRLREFAIHDAALALKVSAPPSHTVAMIRLLREVAADCSIQAHAGNGMLIARFPNFPAGGISRLVVGRLQPAAQLVGGNVVVLASANPGELTRQAVWGGASADVKLMETVKRQFDPKNILNPGRFIYANQ